MYSGVPRPRTDSRCPRISTSARPSLMRLSSEPLDPGEFFQDTLHLAEQLAALLEEPPLLHLEAADRPEPDAQPFSLGRELGDPRLEAPALRGEPGVLGPEGPDQLDRALHVLLEQRQTRLGVVVTHGALLAKGGRFGFHDPAAPGVIHP